jgi:hypothetical protein
MNSTKLWRPVLLSLLAAGPAGGFLFGLLHAGDPDPNPVGRLAYACMMAVRTPLHAGFPPDDSAGAVHALNVWPYVAISFLLILGWLVYRDARLSKRQSERSA